MNRPGRFCRKCPERHAVGHLRLSATPVASAMTSRLNSDSSMPSCPGDPVAHRWSTPATCAVAPTSRAQIFISAPVAAIGLMCREHVVVAGDDGEVGPSEALHRRLVLPRRIGVGEVGNRRSARGLGVRSRRVPSSQGSASGPHASCDHSLRHPVDGVVETAYSSCQLTPSRSASAIAALGPSCPRYRAWVSGRPRPRTSADASIHSPCASTSSRRTNSVWSPSIRSRKQRS